VTPLKKFFVVFFAVYLILGAAIIVFFGPPGMSDSYLAAYKEDHERYLTIVKRKEYKKYEQRPELVKASPALEADAAFVSEYEANPEFIAEQRRRSVYRHLFEVLNIGAVVYLAVRFGRKPLLHFLDAQIAKLRAGLEQAERERREAAERKQAAIARLDRLEEDKARLEKEIDAYIAKQTAEIEAATEDEFARIEREAEERKRHEEQRVAIAIKRELVAKAIETVAEAYRAHATPEQEAALVEQFVRETGQRK